MTRIALDSVVGTARQLPRLQRGLFLACMAVCGWLCLALDADPARAQSGGDGASSFTAEANALAKEVNTTMRDVASSLNLVKDEASAREQQKLLRAQARRLEELLTAVRDTFGQMPPDQASAVRRKVYETHHPDYQASVAAIDTELSRIANNAPAAWTVVDTNIPKLSTSVQRSRVATRLKINAITSHSTATDFLEKSRIAMARTKRKDALNYLRADYIYSSNPPPNELLQWCKALKTPLVVVHWGVGLEVPKVLTKSGAPRSNGSLLDIDEQQQQPEVPARVDQFWIENDILRVAGEIGRAAITALQNRAAKGTFGAWGDKEKPAAATKNSRFSLTSLEKRGATLLARGTRQELLSAAREAQVDLVLAMGVEQHRGNTSMVFRVVNPLTEKNLWESKPINSSMVADALRKGRENPAKPVLENLLNFIEKNVVLTPMLELTSDQVSARAKKLAEGGTANLLKTLCELRYYQRAKLLSDAQAAEVYEQ